MIKVKLLNKISKVGTDVFDKTKYEVGDAVEAPDAIMVRSAVMHEMEFGPELIAIARAGAGVNNIPVDRCADQGIVVFNTPGANANGVKELAIAALLLASRDIVAGVNWANTLEGAENGVAKTVEKGKSAFAGNEILGKTLGVIGLGAIGALVANAAASLGMKVIGCDPYLSAEGARRLSPEIKIADSYDDIYAVSEYITMHIPVTAETKGMFNADLFARMKDGVKIINLSRADLVNADDLKAAIASGKVSKYVTDFPTEETINQKGIVTIPHLGASTEESEDNCAAMAATQLIDYIENGNIVNSVNFPAAKLERGGNARACILHRDGADVSDKIAKAFDAEKVKIVGMINKAKKDRAVTLIDFTGSVSGQFEEAVKAIDGVFKVRIIK